MCVCVFVRVRKEVYFANFNEAKGAGLARVCVRVYTRHTCMNWRGHQDRSQHMTGEPGKACVRVNSNAFVHA